MAALMNPVFVAICVMLVTSSLVYCRPVKREANSDDNFVQVEDMLIESAGKREKRNAIQSGSFGIWPNKIVPYTISSSFDDNEERIILQGMKHWEDYTCLRFRPATSADTYSVLFVTEGGCRSWVGRVSSRLQPQDINLGPGCVYLPTVVHEIGHAVGFYHEHSRSDRDEYISVINRNVRTGFISAFNTVPNGNTLNYGYDYASIMHYSATTFSVANTDAIVSTKPQIHLGEAAELSPLDIAKANALYQCGTHDTHPPPSIVVSEEPYIRRPDGASCGFVTRATGNGNIRSAGFPAHRNNQNCAYVLQVPEGYGIQFQFSGLRLETSPGCTEDYVQVYRGASLASNDLVRYSGFDGGRFCEDRVALYTFTVESRVLTFYYHTDGSNSISNARGLEVAYELKDIDECASLHRCHTCTNTIGSFECGCRPGYYLSKAAKTCFDVNECAVETDGKKGGCDHTCTNYGGSYACSCMAGFFLQADGKSCGRSAPSQTPTALPPGTSLPRIQTTTPTTEVPTVSANCGGGPQTLNDSSGSIQTLDWSQVAYPINTICNWKIECPSTQQVQITFEESFIVAGRMPDCPKDKLTFSGCNENYGPYCHTTAPEPFTLQCNEVDVLFNAGDGRSDTRTGFKFNYKCVTPTTIAPTTIATTPTTIATTATPTTIATTATPTTIAVPTLSPNCGGGPQTLTDSSGSIQTLDWNQVAYPINTICNWKIECPSTQQVQITFEESFIVAGRMPDCPKDKLIFSGCNENYGPYCHTTAPEPFTLKCNEVDVLFDAGDGRSDTRTGFKFNYECVTPTTIAPTTIAPVTLSPNCGGGPQTLTDPSGFIQTLNWRQVAYPINTICNWKIECPSSQRVQIIFEESFIVAGRMPDCPKDQLTFSGCNENYGPYCHTTAPESFTLQCNEVDVLFNAGDGRSDTRTGFKVNYECI